MAGRAVFGHVFFVKKQTKSIKSMNKVRICAVFRTDTHINISTSHMKRRRFCAYAEKQLVRYIVTQVTRWCDGVSQAIPVESGEP